MFRDFPTKESNFMNLKGKVWVEENEKLPLPTERVKTGALSSAFACTLCPSVCKYTVIYSRGEGELDSLIGGLYNLIHYINYENILLQQKVDGSFARLSPLFFPLIIYIILYFCFV